MKNIDKFHEALNSHSPGEPLTRPESGEAYYNLTGFMSLLITINERERVVRENGASHD
jgi:hypothetical protein